MGERGTTITAVAAAGGVLGVCCALPVLFSLGVAGAVAGLSVSSWALVGLALVLAAFAGARWVRRHHTTPTACSTRTARPSTAGLMPDPSTITTKGDHL